MSQPGLNGTKGVVQAADMEEGRRQVTPQDAPGIANGKAHTACMIELASTSQAARQRTAKHLHTQCGNASWQQRCCLTNGQFNEAEAMSRVALEAKKRTHKKNFIWVWSPHVRVLQHCSMITQKSMIKLKWRSRKSLLSESKLGAEHPRTAWI